MILGALKAASLEKNSCLQKDVKKCFCPIPMVNILEKILVIFLILVSTTLKQAIFTYNKVFHLSHLLQNSQ